MGSGMNEQSLTGAHQGLCRRVSEGLYAARLSCGGVDELFVTAVPYGSVHLRTMFEHAMGIVRGADATVLRQDIFGIPAEPDDGMRALEEVCGAHNWPVTWLEEGAGAGTALTGTHFQAVSGAPVDRIHAGGRVIGTVFENEHARYCRLGDICADDVSRPRTEQAREAFGKMEAALGQAEMDFSQVARTWLYLDDILSWYDDFNEVRTQFFNERGVFDGVVPASTGVGGSNAAGAALVADVLAVKPKNDTARVFAVPSPLQCPAPEYGSSFSRAVEIEAPDSRRVLVSGTASIDAEGRTVHIGNMRKQVELSMDVVHAILESRGMDWIDVTRAIAYVKHGPGAETYRRYCADRGLPLLPVVVAENDICRDDLLFEIEVDAVQTREP